MEAIQSSTNDKSVTLVTSAIINDPRYAVLVDFKALGGLITDEEGGMQKQSMQWLADLLSVDRQTLYNWMKIPNFWNLVNERRREISPKGRLAAVHNTWYLKAVKGEFQFLQLWLANFDPNFRMPTQEVKVEAGNSWAALIDKRKNDIIELPDVPEAEVIVDATEQQN